jgi:hypothetical protein
MNIDFCGIKVKTPVAIKINHKQLENVKCFRYLGRMLTDVGRCTCEIKSRIAILHEIRKRKANWIGHILRRNCLLKQVIEGKLNGQIGVTRRRGRRHKKLRDDLKDGRGCFHLKKDAHDRIKWRNRFGRGCGPVVCLTDY